MALITFVILLVGLQQSGGIWDPNSTSSSYLKLPRLNPTTMGCDVLLSVGAESASHIFDQKQWYRLVSSIFVHIDASHWCGNALSIYLYGMRVESVYGIYTTACGSFCFQQLAQAWSQYGV
jgi:membrane associated rhomboid family serine protease